MNTKNQLTVVLIEKNARDAETIRQVLEADDENVYRLTHFQDSGNALEGIEKQLPDIILIGLKSNDSDGDKLFSTIRTLYPDIPLVVLTSADDDGRNIMIESLRPEDILKKEAIHDGMLSRVIFFAIERKRMQKLIQSLTLYDTLTNLPNAHLLMEHLTRDLEAARRRKSQLALIRIRVNHDQSLCDGLDHHTCNRLLVEIATRLRYLVRKCDLIARVGQDEFAILITDLSHPEDAAATAGRIMRAFHGPIMVDDRRVGVSLSAGIAVFPDAGDVAQDYLTRTEIALSSIEDHDKSDFRFYTADGKHA